ncbi:MAG: SGNH/GDSL hydrolase family protein [Spirochaetales bacterium]|nr:SGNH/GDSL hydrolase family protein [Spirochaetales bacterium]
MEIRGEKIAEFFHNFICYRVLDDGFVHPLRYTEKQVAHLSAFSERQATRALASANITVELMTNSSHVGMFMRLLPGSSRESGAVEVFVNGKQSGTFPLINERDCSVDVALEGEMNKVTFYLPWSMQTEIEKIMVDDDSLVRRTGRRNKTIICMGDSITQGYMADEPTKTYVGRLSTHFDAEIINQGNGGYFLDEDLLDEDIGVKPDLVSFAYGTNDYSRNSDPEVIRGNLRSFLDKLTGIFPKTPIICITAPYRGSEKHFNRVKDLGWGYDKLIEVFHEVCSGYSQVTVVDDPVPHGQDCFYSDYTHPTALGFEHYFNKLRPVVKELLG